MPDTQDTFGQPLDPARARQLQGWFERDIPFNRHLGLRVEWLTYGRCLIRLPWADHFVGDAGRGALHGGVTSMLADTAGGAACYSTFARDDECCSTVDLRVDYLRPGPPGDILCEASVIRMGNRVGVTRALVFTGSEANRDTPIATAQAVYSIVRRERSSADA